MPPVSTMLRCAAALFVLVAAANAPARADDEADYATLLRSINPHLQVHQSEAYAHSLVVDAQRNNLDPRLVVALVTVESHWKPNAVSPVGARGLGQLMPQTAALLGVNAWDPAQNIRGATTYLRAMLDHYAAAGNRMLPYALGAYNAGPHAVDRAHGIPRIAETQNYVRKVLAVWRTIKGRIGSALAQASNADPATDDEKMWAATDASALAASATSAAPAATAPSVPAATPSTTLAPAAAGTSTAALPATATP
jgi:hypothetical protein